MRRPAHSIACLLAGAMPALPTAAHGQSAGDEQYEDPFAPAPGEAGGGSTGGGSQDGEVPDSSGGRTTEPGQPSQPEAAPPTPEPAATQSQAPNGQEPLPRTGADAGLLALGGTLLLAGGIALRVRVSEPAPRRR